jgi:sugar phosphate isomerase/epimerase
MNKKRYPFLLGTTSYIVPADIIPNARMLAPLVDDIELVLFESNDASNFPSANVIKELADIGKSFSTGYSVHLLTDKKAGAIEPEERKAFLNAAKKTIERCMPLSPTAWILHLEGIWNCADNEELDLWAERSCRVVESICSVIDKPSTIAIENLGYPWHWHEKIALRNKTSLCCDVGHLWLYFTGCWQDYLVAMLPQTRVIHLHGVSNGKDHISLSAGNNAHIRTFLEIVKRSDYNGIITLEIFSENDFNESMEKVREIWEQLH